MNQSAFQDQIDVLIKNLLEIKKVDVFKDLDELNRLKQENKDLKEKLKFFSEKSMTIDDLYIKKQITYEEYKNRLDQLNEIRDKEEFKK
jgi:regulator of replication initiation timing